MEGNKVGESVMRDHLDDLGFTNIGAIDKEGSIFHVAADWKGRAIKLRINAELGTIDQITE